MGMPVEESRLLEINVGVFRRVGPDKLGPGHKCSTTVETGFCYQEVGNKVLPLITSVESYLQQYGHKKGDDA